MLEEAPPNSVVVYVGAIFLAGFYFLIHSLVTRAFRLPRGGKLTPWQLKPADFGLFVVALFLAVLAVQVGIGSLVVRAIDGTDTESASAILIFGTFFHVTCIAVFLGFQQFLPANDRIPLSTAAVSWFAATGVAVYAFLAVLPVLYGGTLIWIQILETIGISPQHQDVVETFRAADSPLLIAGMIFLVVILAPISEEIIFRGCLYRFLKNYLPVWGSIAISSILFSLMHQNSMGLIALALLGALLCLVYERTGSLKAPILLHAVFNLNTVILILLQNSAE